MDVVLRPKRDISQHDILLDDPQRLLIAISFFITDSSFPFPSPVTAGAGGAGRGGGWGEMGLFAGGGGGRIEAAAGLATIGLAG